MSAPRYPVLLSAVEVVAGKNEFVIWDGVVNEWTCTIAPGTYYLRGDGADDDLLEAVRAAIDDVTGLMVSLSLVLGVDATSQATQVAIAVESLTDAAEVYSDNFDVGILGLRENQRASVPTVDGYAFVGAMSAPCVWVSNEPYTSIETDPSIEATQHRTPAGQVYTFIASDEFHERDLVMDLVAAARARRERNPEDPAATLESWWALARDGRPLEFHLQSIASGSTLDALSSSTLIGRYVLGLESIRRPPVTLRELAQALYTARLKLLGYVP